MDKPKVWRKLRLLAALLATGAAPVPEQTRLAVEAARVTITRDEWGIAHVASKTDADAMFGASYAQAENDFGRIEANDLTALGHTAEAEGEGAVWAGPVRAAVWRSGRPAGAIPRQSLASFGARACPGTHRFYGSSGNSFVAVVEFGPRVRAWAVTAGGESGDPASPHFGDQADRYADGKLRAVHFYPNDVAAHAVRTYHPGAR